MHAKAGHTEEVSTSAPTECPRHNGRFDIRTGEPKGGPVCVRLGTYPARVESRRVLVDLS